MPTAYCLRCQKKVPISYPKKIDNRIQGVCPKCGTRVSVFTRRQQGGIIPPARYLPSRPYKRF